MYEVVKILEMNISQPGTGGRAKTGCPVGGKTGTTDKNSDAWFVGFSPRLATSTWVGFPQGRIPMGPLFHGANVDGGTFPAQIWGQYMKAAAGKYCGKFKAPKEKFKAKAFKSKNGQHRAGRRRRSCRSREEQLEAAQRELDEALARERRPTSARSSRAPGTPQTGAGTGGNGYDPGAYVPQPRRRPRRRGPPPTPAPSDEPQATPTDNGGGARRRSRLAAARCATVAAQMAKEEKVEFEGEVVEALPNAMFRVKLDNDHMVLGHVAGKMRRFRIRILPGDRVRVELSPYDLDRARIVYRHR